MDDSEIEDIIRQQLLKRGKSIAEVEAFLIRAKASPNSIFAVLKTCVNDIAPMIDKVFTEAKKERPQ